MRSYDEILAAHDRHEEERGHIVYLLHNRELVARLPDTLKVWLEQRCHILATAADALAFALGTTTMEIYNGRHPDV